MKTKYNLTEKELEYYISNCASTERLVKFFEMYEGEDFDDLFKDYVVLNKGNAVKLWHKNEDGKFDNFVGFCKEINNMDVQPECSD